MLNIEKGTSFLKRFDVQSLQERLSNYKVPMRRAALTGTALVAAIVLNVAFDQGLQSVDAGDGATKTPRTLLTPVTVLTPGSLRVFTATPTPVKPDRIIVPRSNSGTGDIIIENNVEVDIPAQQGQVAPQSTPETKYVPVPVVPTYPPDTIITNKDALNNFIEEGIRIAQTAEANVVKRTPTPTPGPLQVEIIPKAPVDVRVTETQGLPWWAAFLIGAGAVGLVAAFLSRDRIRVFIHEHTAPPPPH
ncbi:hypothetical protein HYS95_03230 [Candidatus Daviesbacteria bacterium]|nr:hypothetical protein [Candidatus Daviesbacteria bacterium]